MPRLSTTTFITIDLLEFAKDIWNRKDTPEDWNYIIHRADEIAEKYGHNRFVEIMLLAAQQYLEEKQEGAQKRDESEKQNTDWKPADRR